MATTYYYYVGTPVDIATRVTTLDTKLSVDLDLASLYTSTVYNGGTEQVEVTFSSSLSDSQITILNNLTGIILFDQVVGVDVYVTDPNHATRKSYTVANTPTVNHDAESGYNVGSMVTTVAGQTFRCLDNTSGAAVWTPVVAEKILNYTIGNDIIPYIEITGLVYTLVRSILFNGSDVAGTLSSIQVIASITGVGNGQIRVYDSTNAVVIAESTVINNTSPTIFNLPIIGVPSTTPANWEVQMNIGVALVLAIRLHSISIVFS